jgi:hypothetical protein
VQNLVRKRSLSTMAALAFVSVGAAAALGGCPGTLDDPSRYKGDAGPCADVPSEFATTCTATGCHNSKDKAQGLDLQAPDIAGRLVGAAATECSGILLDAANPEQSILYKKLQSPPPCGVQMPSGRAPYGDTELKCILQWIESLGGGSGGAAGTGGTAGAAAGGGGAGGAGGAGGGI